MSEVLQLEQAVQLHDEPKLLVEWSSPWQEFVTSIRPALARSEARLAGEAPFGLVPYRIAILTYLLEAFLIFAAIAIQVKIEEMRPYVVPRLSGHDVIYYTGDELPRTEDLGGAEAGAAGRAGGQEAHHRTQTIRIARGGRLVERVVDAPNLKLPSSRDAVANLLAIRPDPGPPPSEGLRSSRTSPNVATPLIAPPPNVIRDYTRNGIQLEAVIAPAPSVRDQPLTAANLNPTVIPPAPNIPDSHTLVAPALSPAVIPPAPRVSRDRPLTTPSLNTSVIAPAPSVAGEKSQFVPALAANVIPPAPSGVTTEISSVPVQMTNAAVVPPPVSAPERTTARNSKLSLPAPSAIAPPPSANISQDMRRLASGSVSDPSKAVVPPPPQPSSGSFMSSLIGKLFGASEVVPPPPTVNSSARTEAKGASPMTNVVAPPPTVATNAAAGNPHDRRNSMSTMPGGNVVAPPPSVGAFGGTGTRSLASSSAPTLGAPSVVPPPPSLSGQGGGAGNTGGGAGAAGGTLLANNVIPPPPSFGGGASSTGSGLGHKGTGLGTPLDAGSALAPPRGGGSGTNAGAVMSDQPGTKVGLPTTGGTGSLALSPAGGDKPGLGGSGRGISVGRGNGPGSGMNGAGPGVGTAGVGHGSDPSSSGGISPSSGPGGAGNAQSGNPPVRGVDISGGSSIVTIPSFGSDPSANDATSGRSSTQQKRVLGVTIVATATSGGAFEPYKNLLHGQQYTTYIDTSVGTVVMEFADEAAKGDPYNTLTAPAAMRTDLPEGLPRARLVIKCVVTASGNLRNFHVLEPGSAEMTAKVLAALRSWKFQPALRGDQPVEVTAILGFGIDTNDRF